MLDYFSPGQMPNAQPDQNIMPQIGSFMQDPRALQALLAFGTQAMVPQWGGGAVQFAKGVGAAGEASARTTEEQRKQQETESKAQLRESQAGAAEARANTAATRSALTGTIEEGKRQRADLNTRVKLSGLYQNYIRNLDVKNKQIEAANSNPLRPTGTPLMPPEKALPMEEWIRNNPMLTQLGLIPGQTPAAAGGDGTDMGLPPGATQDTASVMQAPPDPKMRQPNQVYMTPKGPLKWTGVEWVGP